jgi:hypothetical protein
VTGRKVRSAGALVRVGAKVLCMDGRKGRKVVKYENGEDNKKAEMVVQTSKQNGTWWVE